MSSLPRPKALTFTSPVTHTASLSSAAARNSAAVAASPISVTVNPKASASAFFVASRAVGVAGSVTTISRSVPKAGPEEHGTPHGQV